MNWQAKTRELIYNHRTSMDALGRAIGEKGRSLRNWLKPKNATKPLNEASVVQAIADHFEVDVLWLLDADLGFPAVPKSKAARAGPGAEASWLSILPPDVARVLAACADPQVAAALRGVVESLAARPPATGQPAKETSAPRTASKA